MRKRHSYSLQLKQDAIKYAENNSVNQTAKKFEVSRKQISEWKKNKVEIGIFFNLNV